MAVVEWAVAPEKQSWPRNWIVLLGSVFGGLFVSTVSIYLIALHRRELRSPEEIDHFSQLPRLAVIARSTAQLRPDVRALTHNAAPARLLAMTSPTDPSIEALRSSVRALQPQGPYALVRYSFGRLVAYEMAQQLVAAGESIEMLCLIDTYVHERCLPLLAWTRYQAQVMEDRMRTWRKLDGRERMRYFSTKALAAADRMRMGKHALRPGADTRGLPAALLRVRESTRLATMMYRPRPSL